ncbi:hypothetical protein N7478_003411 [Penicillium angulare]|uniref:uncharacterized protein n=1 Tax=Penicillium angulare TaxID=116970 RepID=UPI0025418496|nr:uncharacterized protein N7478_003411 [Penicillium angulare]KAJ5287725.1 hypothetical protein N7478_003411 [Penicillium angulare]
MPTDQRELEYHHRPVQTPGAEEILQGSALHPGNDPIPHWSTLRLLQPPQPIDPRQYHGYNNAWGINVLADCEQLNAPQATNIFVSDDSEYSPYYLPSSRLSLMTPSTTMDHLNSPVKCEGDEQFGEPQDPWVGQQHICHPAMKLDHYLKMEDSAGNIQAIPTAAPSPVSTVSHHSYSHSHSHSHSPGAHCTPMSIMAADGSSPTTSLTESSEEDHPADPPYSQLIYQALSQSKDYSLHLQDIYAWFEKNTSKGKDQTQKGWQNSIRHNLSMNQGFVAIKTEARNGKRTVSYWRLSEEAIKKGRVESTTRYRRHSNKRTQNTESPTLRRQGVGQRGGKSATGRGSKSNHHERSARNPVVLHHSQPAPQPLMPMDDAYLPPSGMLPYQESLIASGLPTTEIFGYDRVIGYTDSTHGNISAGYDSVDHYSRWNSQMEHWGGQSPDPNSGSMNGPGDHLGL